MIFRTSDVKKSERERLTIKRLMRFADVESHCPRVTEGRRGDDWNSPEAIEHQQIGIARNDHVSVTVDGEFQKLIVVRITTWGSRQE